MSQKPLTRDDLENLGSLITIKGTDQCLGDLFHTEQHGTFDPNHGRVTVTVEEVKAHNRALDEARVAGLDNQCEIGQGGMFYLIRGTVQTFSGTVVAPRATRYGKTGVRFTRNGRVFRGRARPTSDLVFFKRIS